MKWFYRLTGGRPMVDEGYAFIDRVTWDEVRYYRDRLTGVQWLATGPWALFRVAQEYPPIDTLEVERE